VGQQPFCVQACPTDALVFGLAPAMRAEASTRAQRHGAKLYGVLAAGGTHVLHVLTHSLAEHGLPRVSARRYPRHHIPWRVKVGGVLTLGGGPAGKWRAIRNAVLKPWRLGYRYWHR